MKHYPLTPERVATIGDPRLFWLRAEPQRNGCWEYRGPRGGTSYGYGRIRLAGRITTTHRIAWVMVNGRAIEWPHEVLHHCDNRACINPSHLYLGIQVNNVADRVRRLRGGVGSFLPEGMEEAA